MVAVVNFMVNKKRKVVGIVDWTSFVNVIVKEESDDSVRCPFPRRTSCFMILHVEMLVMVTVAFCLNLCVCTA